MVTTPHIRREGNDMKKEKSVLDFPKEKVTAPKEVSDKSKLVLFPPIASKETKSKVVDYETLRKKAYDWVDEIVKYNGGPAETIRLSNLDDLVFNYGNHISLYSQSNNAYMRVYWPVSGKSIIYAVDGYDRISKNSPELTRLLVMNGLYSYLKSEDPDLCYQVFKT